MNSIYPDEPRKLDIISHLEEFRRRVIVVIAVFIAAAIFAFTQGAFFMQLLKRPMEGVLPELIYIAPAEAFLAYIKISILAGFLLTFPVLLYNIWAYVSPAIHKRSRVRITAWFMASFFLFIAGVAFAYFFAFPAALNFLIGFGNNIAVPRIAIGKYVSFAGAVIMAGGCVFEIPVAMVLAVDAGFVDPDLFRRKRHIAFLIVLILAAVITPTQDMMNMLIFAAPMAFLYEIGVILSRIIGRKRSR